MSVATHTLPADSDVVIEHPGRWLAAIVLMVAALMDLIDATIVNVALPTIRSDLGASATQLEWVVSAYMLAFAAALLTAGRLGDIVGRRRMFLLGVGAFGAASLLCAVAQTPGVLIGARVLQGAAAATMIPQVLATFRSIFDGKERGAVFGMYGAIGGFATAFGLVLGGVLTDADLFGWSWRTVFVINIPIALVVLAAASAVVPETRAEKPRRPDMLGTGILIGALVAIVFPLLEGRRLDWPVWIFACMAGGVVALAGLGVLDARRRHGPIAPLLPTELFRLPAVAAGTVVQMLFGACMQGFFLVFAVWLQSGEGFSPTHAGLTTVAFSVGAFITAPVSVPLATKMGRLVLVAGALMMAAGIVGVDVAVNNTGAEVGTWDLVPGLLVAGAGLGLLVVPLANVVLSAVPARAAGEASGVFNTSQQLGGAIGVAIIGTIFFAHLGGHGFTEAFTHAAPFVAAGYGVCALLALALPRTAVTEVYA
jgi:EmrB/QacA subfamily drug resistance transporter